MIYWLTGQPGSGKTTLGKLLDGVYLGKSILIDGDALRKETRNFDYSENGRRNNVELAQIMASTLDITGEEDIVVALVSPFRDQREEFKKMHDVIEVYLHTSENRGKNQFHVLNYEPPFVNFIEVDTTNKTAYESYYELIQKIDVYRSNK